MDGTLPEQAVMAAGDRDTRYFDLSLDLYPAGDTVSEIVSIDVERVDGETIGASDLKVLTSPEPWISTSTTSPEPVSAGLVVNWWQEATIETETQYAIRLRVGTTQGRALDYTCLQTVSPNVG